MSKHHKYYNTMPKEQQQPLLQLQLEPRSNVPSLTCAFLASLASGGNTYAFGIYGAELKQNLQLTEAQLDTISTAFFAAGLLSGIPGSFVDRFGARISFVLSGVGSAFFLTTYWAIATKLIPVPQPFLVTILSLVGLLSFLFNNLAVGAVFKTIVATAGRGNTGSAVGVAKGFVGLGSGTYAVLFGLIKKPQQANLDFLLMAAVLAICCFTIPAMCLLPKNTYNATLHTPPEKLYKDETTPQHFRVVYTSFLAMATALVVHVIIELYQAGDNKALKDSAREPDYRHAFILLFVWIAPMITLLILPRRKSAVNNNSNHNSDHHNNHSLAYSDSESEISGEQVRFISSDASSADESALLIHHQQTKPYDILALDERKTDYTLWEMLQTTDALLMLWITTVLVGAGTSITNNIGEMAESLEFATSIVTPASLALFSVAQAGARVATGSISEAALEGTTSKCCFPGGVPRTVFFVIASSLSVLAHAILSVATNEIPFVMGVALAGVAFGMVWPLMVLVVGELFGTRHVGANYLFFDGFTLSVGTLFLSKGVAQYIYNKHLPSIAQEEEDDDLLNENPFTCIGLECFQQTHIIVAALSLSCVLASLAIFWMTRPTYQVLMYQSTRHLNNNNHS